MDWSYWASVLSRGGCEQSRKRQVLLDKIKNIGQSLGHVMLELVESGYHIKDNETADVVELGNWAIHFVMNSVPVLIALIEIVEETKKNTRRTRNGRRTNERRCTKRGREG